jgi:acetyltransferase-like isoleucine patch superfamily enzyme
MRIYHYRFLGMEIHPGSIVGKVNCKWPHKVTLGSNCHVEDSVFFKVTHPFSKDNFINIGDRVFIGSRCEFNCSTKIMVGNDCLIAGNTTIVDTGHGMDRDMKINQQPVTCAEIIISDDVWIGANCVILKGVIIGKGSIIGAGSVVNKSIPEYQVWAGVPARYIRNR